MLQLHPGRSLLDHVLVSVSLDFFLCAVVLVENVWSHSIVTHSGMAHEPPREGSYEGYAEKGSTEDGPGSRGIEGADGGGSHGCRDSVVDEHRARVCLLVVAHVVNHGMVAHDDGTAHEGISTGGCPDQSG